MEESFVRSLKTISKYHSLLKGMAMHGQAIATGLNSPSIQTNLILMYIECNCLVSAVQLFDEMPQRSPFVESTVISACSRYAKLDDAKKLFGRLVEPNLMSCNAMISMYVHNGKDVEGLHLLKELYCKGVKPNEYTICSTLLGCANLEALEEGRAIHALVIKEGLSENLVLGNSLINFYFKCRRMEEARCGFDNMTDKDVFSWTTMITGYAQNGKSQEATVLFDMMPKKNVVSWNAMISGYQQQGHDEAALKLYVRMLRNSEMPSSSTLSVILKVCVKLQDFEKGSEVHTQTIKMGFSSNVFVGSMLIDMYAEFGYISYSQKAFDEITEKNVVSWSALASGYAQNGEIFIAADLFNKMPVRNLVSWNSMVAGYVQNGLRAEAIDLFHDMIKEDVKPDQFTISSLLNAFASHKDSRSGRTIHGYAIRTGFDSHTLIGNSLVSMYAEQKAIISASAVFRSMIHYDIVSWTAMVSAYVKNDMILDARRIFDTMPEKNLISWNIMISGYIQLGRSSERNQLRGRDLHILSEEALKLFYKMERASEIKPNEFTYKCALVSCAIIGTLQYARPIHAAIICRGFDLDVGVANALINVYGKCGCLQDAEHVFNVMLKPDLISWNTMITGYSQNEKPREALRIFHKMCKSGMQPNHVTFINVLSACSHAGEVEKGRELFESMRRDYGVEPDQDHYACMVDLLGRAGHLCAAEKLIKDIPVKIDAVVWGTLLGACKTHGNVEIGKRVAESILNSEHKNASTYVTLANILAESGSWNAAAEMRVKLRERQLQTTAACSWIESCSYNH